MKRLTLVLLTAAFMALGLVSSAQADFGLRDLDVTFNNADGSIAPQAGAHPFSMTTTLAFNTRPDQDAGSEVPEGDPRNLEIPQMDGLVGNPTVVPTCDNAAFLAQGNCPATTQVGVTDVIWGEPSAKPDRQPVYSLDPPPGVAMKLGFWILIVPVTVELGVNESFPSNVVASLGNISNVVPVYRSEVTLWGVPAAKAHDPDRRSPQGCGSGCSVNLPPKPFLTAPRACTGPLVTSFKADSWQNPGAWFEASVLTHDDAEPPNPQAMIGCGQLGFNPSIAAQPTSKAASSPSGLDFSLDVNDEGLTNPDPEARANSDIRKAVVTLPQGFTTNPSVAEGLTTCSEAQLAAERAKFANGVGCPEASKIGSVEVETPLLEDKLVRGSLYVATPYENPFGTLLAMYMVIRNEELGIVVKQPLKVESDPVSGQLTTTADNLPQLPFSHFRLHFREGARSPLATPPGCGTHTVRAVLYPWAGGPPVISDSSFQVITGPNSGPCPTGGLPPFKPGLDAGTLNNAAGRFSPFNLRLSRSDAEQEFTRFSIKLPPGITGKLAGIPYCSDAAIAAAKARTGAHGGQEEIDSPSCPLASQIGRTLAGSGVGPSLAYAPGKIYLAGPYNGSNLSMVAITAAKVGPFDLGTVVIRQAFKIDPETAEVFIDSVGSDPIPHIINGIPVHLRDIRAYVDRPNFVLNPTDCTRTSTASTLLGSGLDFGSAFDDRPVTVATPFQAADCAALPFKPRLKLQLKGGTKRGQNPAFIARLNMNGIGEAGIGRAQVTLPHSEFLDQAHIKTICTRVQFKAGAGNGSQCPAGSIYGKARAITPILAEPLTGPVILRSSSNPLPDLVAALGNSQVDFNLVGRIDSVKGQIRNTFETAPDAPVSSFVLEMRGGKKGLLENSTNLCKGTHKALADFTGQNGKRHKFSPKLEAKCPKGRKGKKREARRAGQGRR
ncbi:MAG TPA: hypothetical protein VFX85_11115 [Solirubrobacterales bacterium]|nr:hypothetical protein [Solirubrobacterales bacterium]